MAEQTGSKKPPSYRDLRIWQAATDLAVQVYRVSEAWPADERFGMTSQVRHASVSVAANIAEGWGRQSPAELTRSLLIANGSLKELETLMEVANRVGFASAASKDAVISKCADVGRMLLAMVASVGRSNASAVREGTVKYGVEPNLDDIAFSDEDLLPG